MTAVGGPPFRIHVSCQRCGFRQTFEREVSTPGPIKLICHSCEAPLTVTVPAERFAVAPL